MSSDDTIDFGALLDRRSTNGPDSRIEAGRQTGPSYTTAAHAFLKAMLRVGLRAPLVARN